MRYYPVFLDLRDRDVLLVGAGTVAERKLTLLLRAGARVRVVAPSATASIAAAAERGELRWLQRDFAPADLDGVAFAIAATADAQLNAQVAAEARARNVVVNVVDAPELCSAILPAVIDRDPVQVAIVTGGSAPVLARRLRERIEAVLEPSLGALARLLDRIRPQARTLSPTRRRKLWERAIDGAPAAAVRAGRAVEAEAALRSLLREAGSRFDTRGEVVLVGAGPGDPDLLTVSALRAIQDADIVFHDALVDPGVLERIRRDAEKVSVGKRGGAPSIAQEAIHQALLDAARAGKRVVRLKGGDPLIFARGGEELAFLRAHGVRYRVIPGVTAAAACAAYAGIPLTHREHAQTLTLVTAHGAEALDKLDWRALAAPRQTLAVYMGVAAAADFAARLIGAGAAPSTPVAVIENGSLPQQRVVLARLDGLDAALRRHDVQAPALLLIGTVAALGRELAWFASAPIDDCQEQVDRVRSDLAQAA